MMPNLSCMKILQQSVSDQDPDSDYVVNHVHPGYVDTDMTSHKVHLNSTY